MRRVLIGNLGTIAALGLREVLTEERLDVVAQAGTGTEILLWVSEVRPDVVVLDLDEEFTPELAGVITSEFPAIKVVACSFEEPVMQVFPPFHHGESYVAELSRSLLAKTLKT
ncbi:MAG: hypothetical protein ACRDY7_14970 [Acidimicrobiia bacterium]